MNNKKKCFVIMPFSTTKSCTENKWTEIYDYIIKPAVEESGLGYTCERSSADRQNLIKGILEALNQANVVIADLTDRNPNVFYELGIRHTLTNRTILIAQGKKHIPFDLTPYPVAFYGESPAKIAKFKSAIRKKLEDIETNPDKPDSPVADFLQIKNIDLLAYDKATNLNKLSALISELSSNIRDIDLIVAQLGEHGFTLLRLQNVCMKLFLSTRYINPTKEVLQFTSVCDRWIDFINQVISGFPPKIDESFKEYAKKRANGEILPKKIIFITLLQWFAKIRTDFANDNYQEPKEPVIVLASPEHEQYLKPIE